MIIDPAPLKTTVTGEDSDISDFVRKVNQAVQDGNDDLEHEAQRVLDLLVEKDEEVDSRNERIETLEKQIKNLEDELDNS